MAGAGKFALLLVVVALLSGTEAVAGDSASCAEEAPIPANLTIEDPFLLSLVQEIALRSPAFRRQLIIIGAAPSLAARLHYAGRARVSGTLSQTVIARTNTGLRADIEIPMPLLFARRYIEFIAHELEHVIEQLEGLDFRALARESGSGVYRLGWISGQPYETDRAQSMGQLVEQEYLDHESDDTSSCESVD